MQISSLQAYRLASMPYRVFTERCRGGWPSPERTEPVFSLVSEWLELLAAIREKSLSKDVQILHDAIAAERQDQAAAAKREKLERLNETLRLLGENPGTLPPMQSPVPAGPQSYELARDLVEKAQQANLRDRLPGEHLEAFDVGVLVGRGIAEELDEPGSLFIWTVLGRCGREAWITGRPAGTPLGPRQSIHSMVLDRLPELDAMLSREWPEPASRSTSCPVAQKMDLLVAKTDQVRHDIADYAEAAATDAVTHDQSSGTLKLMTPNEAAKEFGISATVLRREFDAGRIRGRMVGSHRKLDRDSVKQWCHKRDEQDEGKQHQAAPSPRPRKPPRYLK